MTAEPDDYTPRDYVPMTATLPDGQRILISLFLPPGVRPHYASIAVQQGDLHKRWGPPIDLQLAP